MPIPGDWPGFPTLSHDTHVGRGRDSSPGGRDFGGRAAENVDSEVANGYFFCDRTTGKSPLDAAYGQ